LIAAVFRSFKALKVKTWMDSFTDERNSWFNAVRLEDSHDYSSATLIYIEDASRCLGRSLFIRAAMSSSCAASCIATLGDSTDALKLYSSAALLYEHSGDLSIGKSLRESLWSLLHAFEYFTLISDHLSAERVSKKYADLARRVDRFEANSVFEALKVRRDSVLEARSNLSAPPNGYVQKNVPESSRIQRSVKSFLQQVETLTLRVPETRESEEAPKVADGNFAYEPELDYNERRIVS
jgi:hypothetical protein